jgi:MFS family permease
VSSGVLGRVGKSLQNRNFRIYLGGQAVSHSGMWIQIVAELWIIAELTQSGTALGLHSILRYGPILVLGVFAGVLGDRVDRRKLLFISQSLLMTCAGALALVIWSATPSIVAIYVLVLIQGAVYSVDLPIRRSFVRDLTTDTEISNAVSLNSTVGTLSRTIGPAIAGGVIATLGVEWCFVINAITYPVVLASLAVVDRSQLRSHVMAPRGPGQIRAGLRYAWSERTLRINLVLTVVIVLFAWQWRVILPAYASVEFLGDATLFGFFLSTLSLGSVVGALYSAHQTRLGSRHLMVSGAGLAVGLAASAWAPSLVFAFTGMFLLGAAGSAFNIGTQSRIQLAVDSHMTTRVLSLYSVGFHGSTAIGGLVVGVAVDLWSARAAFALSALVVGFTTAFYWYSQTRRSGTHRLD